MCKLFGLNVYSKGKESLILDLESIKHKVHIISGNAEVFKYPLKDELLFEKFLDKSSIIIPDGISVQLPAKIRNKKSVERIAGIDLMTSLLERYENGNKSIFLLGAKDDILIKTVDNLEKKYPKLNIAGYHHGYFDIENPQDIINQIKKSNADALFVAMGTPLQESFIFKHMDELPCKLYMGVGGSFNVLSGEIKRAPKLISSIGLEWLYRIFQEPSKIKRFNHNIIFTLKALLKG